MYTPASAADSDGFTFVDLLATIAILAVLTAIVVPAAVSTLRTYRRNLAAWELTTELRRVQSLAVSRGAVFVLQWAESDRDGAYRIVRDDDGHCTLPASDAPVDDVRVVSDWVRVDDRFAGIRLDEITDAGGRVLDGVGYLATGSAVGVCGTASFPIEIQLRDRAGNVETIEVRRSGLTSRR